METQDNQWENFLETGENVSKALKPKQIVDVQKELKSKYPGVPIPNANRIVTAISVKQQRGIRIQKGAR